MSALPDPDSIVIKLFHEVDILLKQYVHHGYQAMVGALKTPISLAITLYIILLGISVMYGWVKSDLNQLVRHILKITLIFTFAMHWDVFAEYFIKLVINAASELGAVMMSVAPGKITSYAHLGIDGALQLVLTAFTHLGAHIMHSASWRNPTPLMTGAIVWGFGYAQVLVAIFELLFAKIMMSVLLALAPLFICFPLFKFSNGWFERWLGAVVGFSFLLLFVSASLGFTLSVTEWALPLHAISNHLPVSLVSFVPVMVIGFLNVGILLKASHYASAIAGGVTTSSGSSVLAGAAGSFIGASMSTTLLGRRIAGKGLKGAIGVHGTGVGLANRASDAISDGAGKAVNAGKSAVSAVKAKLRGR